MLVRVLHGNHLPALPDHLPAHQRDGSLLPGRDDVHRRSMQDMHAAAAGPGKEAPPSSSSSVARVALEGPNATLRG